MLTDKQRAAAEALLVIRPPVLPGTRAILSATASNEWHDKVNAAIREHGIGRHNVNEFCDVAGVAD
jgi:hypothetical protein